jgi:hypothetical protein
MRSLFTTPAVLAALVVLAGLAADLDTYWP